MTEDDKTDLSNFGGGVDNTKADDPEDKDNLSLSKWLTSPSVSVYWDREKPYGFNTFSVTTQKRPDIIIDAKVNTFAVEVKDYEKTGCVINGAEQAEGYWRDIESGKAEYSISTGIGVLYSSVLDSEDPNAHSVPAAYYIVPGNGKRSNNWDYIPFYKHGH